MRCMVEGVRRTAQRSVSTRTPSTTLRAVPLPVPGRKALSYTAQICDGTRVMSHRAAPLNILVQPPEVPLVFNAWTVVQAVHGALRRWR